MPSDRARISHDPTRRWRSVVAQQGRVTLEADVNETSMLVQEQRRAEVIDIVGPAGTPDDGYKVGSPAPGRISVGPGTMYLGGWRLSLDAPIVDDAQPDWLDQTPPGALLPDHEVVLLRAMEQEVTAVEDRVLREVALGGPDTAARSRLMQHILRLPIQGDTCAEAAAELLKLFAAQGLTLDPKTLELRSTATLLAGPVPPPPNPDPCDPPAQGGYLGADNQLIRVTVTAFDPATGKGRLLWGYNNASFLYRAVAAAADEVILGSDPLDGDYTPKVGQAVEVLRARVDFGRGEYIAAPEGVVTTLSQPYEPDTRTLTLPANLPAAYFPDPSGRPLFVRLWQEELAFQVNQPVALGQIGLEVTVDLDALSALWGRPFWHFAVRPSTPVEIYPARYQLAPQPPEGPRQWICRLAVTGWLREKFVLFDDCRVPFKPLTELEDCGCCAVVLSPDEVAGGHGLQAAIDKLSAKGRATVALEPGRYLLRAPIQLGPQHEGLVLEGCQDGAVLAADPEFLGEFRQGLVVMHRTDEVTLRRLRFDLPLVPGSDPTRGRIFLAAARLETFVSVGVMAVHCARLRVEDCLFRYAVPVRANLLAVGVYGRSESWGLTLRGNSFLHDEEYQDNDDFRRILLGYALAPDSPDGPRLATGAFSEPGIGDALLDDAEIVGNRFAGLTAGVVIRARMGYIRCASNRVIDCVGGLHFYTSDIGATVQVLKQAIGLFMNFAPAVALAASATLNTLLLSITNDLGLLIARPPPTGLPQAATSAVINNTVLRLVAAEFRQQAAVGFAAIRAAAVDPATGQPPSGRVAAVKVDSLSQRVFDRATIVATAARIAAKRSRPVLHIRDNDVQSRGLMRPIDVVPSTPGKPAAPPPNGVFAGISVVLEQGEGEAAVMLQDNRVSMASAESPAAGVLYPELAVATGNLLVQPRYQGENLRYAFMLVGETKDDRDQPIDVMGNLVKVASFIVPARASTVPPSSWYSLNVTA